MRFHNNCLRFQSKLDALSVAVRNSLLVRNTVLMTVGQVFRIILLATYFVVITRSLGAKGYGAFAGVAAFVAIAAPFAGLGSGNLLVKNVARDPTLFKKYWGSALAITTCSG